MAGAQTIGSVLEDHRINEFCHAFLFGTARYNATEAYLVINPTVSRGSASELGSRLLARVETQQALARMAREALARNELRANEIIGHWLAMSVANVMDYFDIDEKGQLSLKDLTKLDVAVQRNISQLEVTTEKVNEMVTAQKVKLKLVDRRAVLDSMAKAAELFGKLAREDQGNDGIASAIEQGFERVRKRMGGQTIDATAAIEGEVVA